MCLQNNLNQWVNMNKRLEMDCERIDAAIFTGDGIYDSENIQGVLNYAYRWIKELELRLPFDVMERIKVLLEDLKRDGDKRIKEYNERVPKECFLTVGPWAMSYVRERTLVGPQKTLAISRRDGADFPTSDVVKIFPELKEVFGNLFPAVVEQATHYPNRGYTRLYTELEPCEEVSPTA